MDFAVILQSQKAFFATHQTKSIAFRKSNLLKLKKLLQSNEDKLYQAIYQDFRKGKFDTFFTELNMVYREIDFFLKNLSKLSRPKRVKTSLMLQPGKSCIHNDPLGATLVIGAWNYPYQLTLIPVISALAAGNTCIVKPSELPKNTMYLLAELIHSSFPSNYLYVAAGGISETTKLLQLRFDKIFFTGSPKVGRIVYEAAAKNMVPVVLELGGKSPAIVTETADLDVAAKRLIWGKFLNAGQTCIAPDYLVVQRTVKAKLLELMKKKLDEINYSDGANHYTSIINIENFNRIVNLLDQSKIVYGGAYNDQTLYIAPTLMDHVSWEDSIMQEEIFGPVFPMIVYTDYDELLTKIATGEKPLAAYLFTEEKEDKRKFLNLLSFGGGCINDTLVHVATEHLPFGGVGNSGIGNYHGAFGFYTFSHQKSIVEKANWGEPNWKYPPYTDKKMNLLRKLIEFFT